MALRARPLLLLILLGWSAAAMGKPQEQDFGFAGPDLGNAGYGNGPLMNSTGPLLNSTVPPLNSTMPPLNSTMPPLNSTMHPLNSTGSPLNSTAAGHGLAGNVSTLPPAQVRADAVEEDCDMGGPSPGATTPAAPGKRQGATQLCAFKCRSGQCVADISYKCDGNVDCLDQSDEDRALCDRPNLFTELRVGQTKSLCVYHEERHGHIHFDLCGDRDCNKIDFKGVSTDGSLRYKAAQGCNTQGFQCPCGFSNAPRSWNNIPPGALSFEVTRNQTHLLVSMPDRPRTMAAVAVGDNRSRLKVRPEMWWSDMRVDFNGRCQQSAPMSRVRDDSSCPPPVKDTIKAYFKDRHLD